MVPSIAHSDAPFVLVQRASSAFAPLHEGYSSPGGTVVELAINGSSFRNGCLRIVSESADLPISWAMWLESVEAALPGTDLPQPRGLLVWAGNQDLITRLIRCASSFSTSLGPGLAELAPLIFQALPSAPDVRGIRVPTLFAGENDHNAVEKLGKELYGKVYVQPCMVDRICTSRDVLCDEVNVDGESILRKVLSVTCEPYPGCLVVLPRNREESDASGDCTMTNGSATMDVSDFSSIVSHESSGSLSSSDDDDGSRGSGSGSGSDLCGIPFVGYYDGKDTMHVFHPQANIEAEYLCRRKLLIVNGMHTTLAFLTLCEHLPKDRDPIPLEKDRLTTPHDAYELITLATASEWTRRIIWAWAVARQLLLVHEFGVAVMMQAHSVTTPEDAIEVLIEYTRQTLNRFANTHDTTGRILGGGVTNRYQGRLEPVKLFLETHADVFEAPLSKQIMQKMGVTAIQMVEAVTNLTRNAKQLTSLRSELDNKDELAAEMAEEQASAADDFLDHSADAPAQELRPRESPVVVIV